MQQVKKGLLVWSGIMRIPDIYAFSRLQYVRAFFDFFIHLEFHASRAKNKRGFFSLWVKPRSANVQESEGGRAYHRPSPPKR
jgi:hypothetical protein